MNRMLLGYSPDFDIFDSASNTSLAPTRADREAVAFDTQSTEQAAELIGTLGRPGFATMLGRLVRRTALDSGRPLKDAVAAELVDLLETAAWRALPRSDAPIATDAAAAFGRANRFFGIELEGLSPEDKEFEAARRFVQLSAEAARQAARTPAQLPPRAAARRAAALAARRYAPGWMQAAVPALASAQPSSSFARTGRWLRHGPGVIVLNPDSQGPPPRRLRPIPTQGDRYA
ncbi:MAG TPA: hypothetical protein VLI06_01415 [Solimonas sp.]|nr:hypothetical protein [Solimonas sp.]